MMAQKRAYPNLPHGGFIGYVYILSIDIPQALMLQQPDIHRRLLENVERDTALNRGKRRRTGVDFFYRQIIRSGFELYFSIC